ncbi:MAG: TonB-dependent receptor [Bacteroidetes bacterium]|nr:TonB-dependent receptor [Bacteroidota bacterium]
MRKQSLYVLLMLLASTTLMFAQYGKISGVVTDQETKEPLVGATVILEGTAYGASTDVDGNYVILNVPAGTYNVKVSYIGYQPTTIMGVKIIAGLTRDLNVQLVSSAVQTKEVTVIAERPLIEKTATNAVRMQTAEEIEKLPVRGIQGYVRLQAGVVEQNGTLYIRGSRNDEVGYIVEGANVKNIVGSNARHDYGGSLVTVIPEALEEISVQAGGYSAEFGGANAGIIQQTFKTAGTDVKVTLQAETDNFGNYPGKKFLDTYSYGYSDYVATISLPITSRLKFFGAFQNTFQRDRDIWFWSGADFGYLKDNGLSGGKKGDSALVKWDPGNVPGRMNNRYTVNGTLSLDLNPLQIRFAGGFTWSRNMNNSQIRNIFNLARVAVGDNSNLLLSGKANYFITHNTFLEATVSYVDQRNKSYDPLFGDDVMKYQDSVAAAAYGYQFVTLTQPPMPYNFNGFQFRRPGAVISGFSKDKRVNMSGSVALTTQLENHELKLGGSYELWTVSHWDIDVTSVYSSVVNSAENINLARDRQQFAKILRAVCTVNNYGFDEFGAPLTKGPDGPKHPYFGAAYIQDKMEFQDIIVNAGLRWDIMNLDGWYFNDIREIGYDNSEFLIHPGKRGKRTFQYFSPRLGFSFPASDRTVFHLQYGKFVQAPPLYATYRSRAMAVFILQGGYFFNNPIGYNLEPVKTTQYEIGFAQQISDAIALDITGFYKNIHGQLQTAYFPQPATSPVSSYYAYVNGDFETVMGVEFTLRMRRMERVQAQVNYTLQDARGTNSYANGTISLLNTGGTPPSMVVPLDYAQRHRGSLSLDYRWGKNDGGPILEQLGFNLLFTFNSGHPYTHATGSGGQQAVELGNLLNDGDARTRMPVEPINSSTTPWVYQLDLRVDKTFSLGIADINVYVYVQNLLNTKNVINVYYRTGNAYDDGWLSDPVASGKTVQTFGQTYVDLYRVINLENNQHQLRQNGFVNFGSPRQIRVGARVEL